MTEGCTNYVKTSYMIHWLAAMREQAERNTTSDTGHKLALDPSTEAASTS
jgi:hypothetical protein